MTTIATISRCQQRVSELTFEDLLELKAESLRINDTFLKKLRRAKDRISSSDSTGKLSWFQDEFQSSLKNAYLSGEIYRPIPYLVEVQSEETLLELENIKSYVTSNDLTYLSGDQNHQLWETIACLTSLWDLYEQTWAILCLMVLEQDDDENVSLLKGGLNPIITFLQRQLDNSETSVDEDLNLVILISLKQHLSQHALLFKDLNKVDVLVEIMSEIHSICEFLIDSSEQHKPILRTAYDSQMYTWLKLRNDCIASIVSWHAEDPKRLADWEASHVAHLYQQQSDRLEEKLVSELKDKFSASASFVKHWQLRGLISGKLLPSQVKNYKKLRSEELPSLFGFKTSLSLQEKKEDSVVEADLNLAVKRLIYLQDAYGSFYQEEMSFKQEAIIDYRLVHLQAKVSSSLMWEQLKAVEKVYPYLLSKELDKGKQEAEQLRDLPQAYLQCRNDRLSWPVVRNETFKWCWLNHQLSSNKLEVGEAHKAVKNLKLNDQVLLQVLSLGRAEVSSSRTLRLTLLSKGWAKKWLKALASEEGIDLKKT